MQSYCEDDTKIAYIEDQHESLGVFVASRLMPLDKNPGLCSIDIVEILEE